MFHDLTYAVRWLIRTPGFAAAAILSLGLGVGVNVGMFTLVDAVLLRPLPVSEPGRLVDVFTTGGDGDTHATSSYPDYLDLKARNTVFADVIAYSPMFAGLSLGDRSRLVFGHVVTSNHFQVLGIQPGRGRLLAPEDDAPGAARVVVISHRFWTREFGGDPGAVGRDLHLRGQPYTIVGVAPASFPGVVPLMAPDLWLPMAHVDDVEPGGIIDVVPGPGATRLERRGSRFLFVKGRLRPGVTAEAAHANVRVVGAQLAAEYPQTNRDREMSAVPTSDVRLLVPEAGGPLTAGGAGVMAAAGLVLLIACANVTGLLLARASSRARELAVRAAIGASRGRLIRQMLIEGLVVGAAGVLVAVGVAWALVRAVLAIDLPFGDLPVEVGITSRVLAFAAGVALVSGLVASLSPALTASSRSLVTALRGPAQAGASRARRWGLRELLVAGQVALTVVLLVTAGLLLRSVSASRAADLGFDARGLALIAFDTDMVRYSANESREFWARARARVAQLPGIEGVALATPRAPLELNFSTQEFRLDDRAYAEGQRGEILNNAMVSTGYFSTLGVPIVRGRDFTDADREGAPPVVVVSEALARRFWPDGSAVGRTLTLVSAGRRYEIVGVSADYRVRTVGEAPTPYVHFALAQQPATYHTLLARTSGDDEQALTAIRRELLAMEPRLVFVTQGTMARTVATTLLPARAGSMAASAFGALGTVLAAIGLYGVIAFAVARRTREIGLRVALGASRADILRMVIRQGGLIVAAGALIGVVFAAVAASALGGLLYGVGAADPATWASAAAVIIAATTLAHAVPALRALGVDPAETLREDM